MSSPLPLAPVAASKPKHTRHAVTYFKIYDTRAQPRDLSFLASSASEFGRNTRDRVAGKVVKNLTLEDIHWLLEIQLRDGTFCWFGWDSGNTGNLLIESRKCIKCSKHHRFHFSRFSCLRSCCTCLNVCRNFFLCWRKFKMFRTT